VVALQNFPHALYDEDEVLKSMGENPSFWDPVIPIFVNEYWDRAWYGMAFTLFAWASSNLCS
jgi:hypothetical protein